MWVTDQQTKHDFNVITSSPVDSARLYASAAAPSEPAPDSDMAESSPVVPQRTRTRLQRLSSFLPSLVTRATSKPFQDLPRDAPPVPSRKPAPGHYRAASDSLAPNASSASLPQHIGRLQKAEPPPRTPQIPADLPGPPPLSSSPQKRTLRKSHSPVRPPVPSKTSPSVSPNLHPRLRGDSTTAPPAFNDVSSGRTVSAPVAGKENVASTNKVRRSWLPGGKSRQVSRDIPETQPHAWIISGDQNIEYSLEFLLRGEMVPELWDDTADTYVYLFPRNTSLAAFKVHSSNLSSAKRLISQIYGDVDAGRSRGRSFDGRGTLSIEDATRNLNLRGPGTPPYTPLSNPLDNFSNSDGSGDSYRSFPDAPREIHLYFPINLSTRAPGPALSKNDVQSLVDVRNLFAFLSGESLVATRECPTLFKIFLSISALLQQFEFSNSDGSTYGEAAAVSFDNYQHQMRFGDVAHSREKTLEALILGEAMRSSELYNEAFAHAAGKYPAIKAMNSPLYDMISLSTRNRLERGHLDLKQRQQSADLRLTDFEFPSIFSGIGASTSRPEARAVNFKAWKVHFLALKKLIVSHYKTMYGDWPPKASSKKNQFEENGLNRLVLKGLYRDLCSLYDLLANREALTTRHYDASDDMEETNTDPTMSVLRTVLSEYDRSSPPVQPPIPYDTPRVPTMAAIDATYPSLSPTEQHKHSTRKLKEYETLLLLAKSHNMDSDIKTPFLEMFSNFEEREAKGKNAQELADQRYGHWLFLYAVLQALPMLVVDIPGLRYTQGVEYFLCEPPLGELPWMEGSAGAGSKMAWYGVQGGGGVVSLPSDVVLHGVEGIFQRSHCWVAAEKWMAGSYSLEPGMAPPAAMEYSTQGILSPLEPPPGLAGGNFGSRPSSRGRDSATSSPGLSPHDYSDDDRRSRGRNSVVMGLEQLPIPAGMRNLSDDRGRGANSRSRSRACSPAVLPYGMMRPGSGSGAAEGDSPPQTGSAGKGGASTFDDILGNLKAETETDKKGRRRSIFDMGNN
ncbi:choriogenin Hminor [Phlyctema vagabunda]|uniref:Choriogenin Hminor n=1 Tax=Phlyctema vagabunda TaxID=108571 RepID=A0ABR4P246_9HELO